MRSQGALFVDGLNCSVDIVAVKESETGVWGALRAN